MKYKGVTLFSAALILLGSVGTATSYTVDNPTHVSAAGTDTTISKLLGDNTNVLNKVLSSDSDSKDETATEYKINYDVRNADDDSKASAAANYLTKVAKVTKNSDGSYEVNMQAKVVKAMDTSDTTPLLQITSIDGEKNINVDEDKTSDAINNIYTFSFSVPDLISLENEIPILFVITIPADVLNPKAGPDDKPMVMEPSANLKFDKLSLSDAMISEGDTDNANKVLKDQIDDLQNQLDSLTKSKNDTDAKNKDLSNTINDLNSQLKKLKADKDASDSEVTSLTKKVSDLESDKKDLQDQQDKLNSQITELTEKVNKLTDTGSVLSNTLSDAQNELKKAKAAKSDLEDKLSALQTVADSLKEQLNQALADSNSAEPIDVDDETDTNYTYEVLKENPSDGTSVSSKYFTKKAKVTKNSDGTYTVQMQLNYPKSYGKNAVTFTKIAGNNITDSQYSIKEDGDNYSQTFNFSTDDIDDYIPVTMKMDIAEPKFSATESANFKLKKASDSSDELSELESELESLQDQLSDANNATQAAKDELASKIKDYEAQINKLKSGDSSDDDIKDEYQVPYVVNKTGTNTASASEQYFTQTAFVNPNDDGTFSVEVQMDYPLSYGEDAVKIDSVNGNDIDQSTVTTTSDDNSYLKSFKFNIDNLSDLNNAIPVTMDINIAGGIFSGTETADLVFDTTDLPIQDPTNNGNKQVLDNGSTGSGTAATSGTTLGTTGTTGTTGNTSGSLPQTDAKGLPTYIMYAGFIMLAVTLAGAGKVKFTGKK
ncbi:hypothetical protein [Companilactobacillus sp. HBUAS59699]|uniref:hypothetical protein n=1 Tax=Companilactobacillus sp. HBUAS59699 TaxID=3109358 RepID=UPI002FF1ADA5